MEVTCDRCNAEYEFEQALISPGGTTVKCTGCGHLFKVFRDAIPEDTESGSSVAAASGGQSSWIVELASGQRREFPSLKEVTERIKARELTRDDRISRTGRAFRRLGDIEELSRFFSVTPTASSTTGSQQEAVRSQRAQATSTPPPPLPEVARERARTITTPPVSERPRRPTPVPQPPLLPSLPKRQPQPPTPSPPTPSPVRTPESHHSPASAPPPLPPSPSPPVEPNADDPTDPNLPLGRTSIAESKGLGRGLKWSMAIALVIAIGMVSGLLIWATPPSTSPPVPASQTPSQEAQPEPSKASVSATVERGDRQLESYDLRKFPEAIVAYEIALAQVPNDPHLLSSLSRVHAQWSQMLLFALADRRSASEPHAVPPELASLSAEQQNHADAAKELAVRAARKNPGNEEAEVALADALRLSGNLVGARLELDRVLESQTQPDAETLRVASLLAIAEAQGDLAAGREAAEAATQRSDTCISCKVLLVRILAAARATEAARAALADLSSKAPDLQEIEHLRRLLSRPASTSIPAARTPHESAQLPSAPSPEAMAQADALCQRGEDLLEDGATTRAKAQFEQALKLAPNGPRALTGLGYVALERDAPRRALSHFQQAASHNYPEALLGLGEAYRAIDRPNAAIRAYRTYLSKFGGLRGASIARQQLQALQDAKSAPAP